MLNSNPHNMVNVGPLMAEFFRFRSLGHPANFNEFCVFEFASSLRYYTAVVQRKSTKLCTLFGLLLGWYTIYDSV